MKKYNTIVLTEEDFKEELYDVLGQTLRLLFSAGYECAVREEEKGILIIDFNYDRSLGYGNEVVQWFRLDYDEDDIDYAEKRDLDSLSNDEKIDNSLSNLDLFDILTGRYNLKNDK